MKGWRPSIADCRTELNASKSQQATRRRWRQDAIRRFTGSAYENWDANRELDPENTAFTQIATMIPSMASGVPQCRLSSARGQDTAKKTLALQAAANRAAREQKMATVCEHVATDMLFTWGVAKVLRAPRPGQGYRSTPMNMPRMRYVPARWFLHDIAAMDAETWAWSADARVVYLTDLEDEAENDPTSGWDAEVLEGYQTNPLPKYFRSGDTYGRSEEGTAIDRGELVLWELWVRDWEWDEEELDEWEEQLGVRPTRANGYNGALVTMTDEATTEEMNSERMGDQQWIRAPRPFYGEAHGPHVLFGSYVVPEESDPLGLLAATADQSEEMNDHARVMSTSFRQYKRMNVFKNEEAVDLVQNAGHDFVVAAPMLNFEEGKGWVKMEIGGGSDQQLIHMKLLHDRWERNAGLDQSGMGSADAGATATAVMTAAGRSASRSGWILTKYQRGLSDVFRKMLWYLWHDETMMIPVDERAAKEMGEENVQGSTWFFGGDDPSASLARLEEIRDEESGREREAWAAMVDEMKRNIAMAPADDPIAGNAFSDLEITIDLSTLTADSPQTQAFNAQQMQVGIQESAMVAQMPWVNPLEWVKLRSRMMGMPQFAEVIMVDQMQQAQQAAMRAMQAGGEEPGDRPGLQRTGAKAPAFQGRGDQFMANAAGSTNGSGASSSQRGQAKPRPTSAGSSAPRTGVSPAGGASANGSGF